MAVEQALLWFGVLTLVMLSIEVNTTYVTKGFGFGFSSNRPAAEKTGLPLRISRAYVNQVESAAYIVPVLAAAAFQGLTGFGVETAALLVVAGRFGFALFYFTGIHFARVPFFAVTVLSVIYLIYALLTQGAAV